MEARAMVSGEPSSHHMELSAIAKLLAGYAYRYGSETQLQDGLQRVLEAAGYTVERERVLDAKSRVDLWVGGIVIEVKVGGSFSSALHQVGRYISHPEVRAVVLASTERWASDALVDRPAWGGKAFQMLRVRRQTL